MKYLPPCAALTILMASLAYSVRFTQADIAKTETDIMNEFEGKGFAVEQVSLVQESDRRLSGFVRFKKTSGLLNPTLTKNCVVTMNRHTARSIWQCK